MQLESTLFGVVVLQIKPQLEKLLRLPADTLTKEIQLTQHLMEMFITYQIPADLLAYDPDTPLPDEAFRPTCPKGHALENRGVRDTGWACDARAPLTSRGCKRGCTGFHQSAEWGNFH